MENWDIEVGTVEDISLFLFSYETCEETYYPTQGRVHYFCNYFDCNTSILNTNEMLQSNTII
jgi:hypothetical protein